MSSHDSSQKHLEGQEPAQYNGSNIARMTTVGGHVADNSQYGLPVQHRKLGSPFPLGLFAFATTTFALSMYNLKPRGIEVPNAIVTLALVYGGGTQWIAGVFEFVCGNTFGAVAFMTFGSFWLSYCVFLIPWFGVGAAFTTASGALDPSFNQAVAIYLWAWFIVVFIIILASFKSSVATVVTLVLVELVIMLLAIGNMTGNEKIIEAGGGMGLATAAAAFYTGAAALLTPDLSYFQLPVGLLGQR